MGSHILDGSPWDVSSKARRDSTAFDQSWLQKRPSLVTLQRLGYACHRLYGLLLHEDWALSTSRAWHCNHRVRHGFGHRSRRVDLRQWEPSRWLQASQCHYPSTCLQRVQICHPSHHHASQIVEYPVTYRERAHTHCKTSQRVCSTNLDAQSNHHL